MGGAWAPRQGVVVAPLGEAGWLRGGRGRSVAASNAAPLIVAALAGSAHVAA